MVKSKRIPSTTPSPGAARRHNAGQHLHARHHRGEHAHAHQVGKTLQLCTFTIFDPCVALHLHLREDLPTDLTLNLDLHKITPFPMTVPCLNGVGSCEYEVVMLLLEYILMMVMLEYILIMVITNDYEFMMRHMIQLKPIFGSHNNKLL